MGTRGTTAVIKDGEFKIAQYGQWDHYITGQGMTALNFLNGEGNVEALRKAVDEVTYPTKEDIAAALKSVGSEDGWVTMEQGNAFDKIYPALSRNHGAKILNMVANEGVREIQKDETFPMDSLFCEGAYVVDLDNNVFEVYTGFQTTKAKGRFVESVTEANKDGYWPVTLLGSFPLDDLPSEFTEEYDDETDETIYTAVYPDGREVNLT